MLDRPRRGIATGTEAWAGATVLLDAVSGCCTSAILMRYSSGPLPIPANGC